MQTGYCLNCGHAKEMHGGPDGCTAEPAAGYCGCDHFVDESVREELE